MQAFNLEFKFNLHINIENCLKHVHLNTVYPFGQSLLLQGIHCAERGAKLRVALIARRLSLWIVVAYFVAHASTERRLRGAGTMCHKQHAEPGRIVAAALLLLLLMLPGWSAFSAAAAAAADSDFEFSKTVINKQGEQCMRVSWVCRCWCCSVATPLPLADSKQASSTSVGGCCTLRAVSFCLVSSCCRCHCCCVLASISRVRRTCKVRFVVARSPLVSFFFWKKTI